MDPSNATRTSPCNRDDARSRLKQAEAYLWVAELVLEDGGEAEGGVAASLAVLGGIAASDAACCAKLKKRPRGQDHKEAVQILATVEPGGESMAKDLSRLLASKANAHYGVGLVGKGDANRLVGYARRLVNLASTAVEA